jgi:hypothetical protein
MPTPYSVGEVAGTLTVRVNAAKPELGATMSPDVQETAPVPAPVQAQSVPVNDAMV